MAPTLEALPRFRWTYGRVFQHMHFDERWSDTVRESAARGVVVHVMRTVSVLDFFCLDYLVQRFGLPALRFVNDLGALGRLEPYGTRDRRLRLRPQERQHDSLTRVVQDRQSALLFLRRAPEQKPGAGADEDLIHTLVELQRQSDVPILLVPQTFVWSRQPERKHPGFRDLFLGPSDEPGQLRTLIRFAMNFRNPRFRSGEPFDVAEFLAERRGLSDAEAADAIRYAMLRRIERERRLVVGPASKSAGRIREELLRSPRLRQHIESDAKSRKESLEETERYAERELKRLCAKQDPSVLNLVGLGLDQLWSRVYSGFEVDEEGFERVREAARHGPLIMLPSHKSHVDYLILSYVMERKAMSAPLIAAGDNLSFFPLGPLLRRCGAFFIKRSFRGRKLYAALVDAYIRKVLVEGHNVEFFMEGGRSRTGKLLPPKLGILSMVVDAGLKLPNVELSFVPISVGYERIIEERSYTHEQEGGDKRPESVGGLLRTGRLLRSRYGRIYVQFGEIFSLQDLLREAAALADAEPGLHELRPKERRALIQRIAYRCTYEINRVTIVTPSALVATALMAHRNRGLRHEDLVERCAELLGALARVGARVAPSLLKEGRLPEGPIDTEAARRVLREDSVEEALALFRNARAVETKDGVHSVPEARRLGLEYHKNSILHFFVPSALISAALLTADGATEDGLRERVRTLSRVFKYEFMYRADAPFDDIFDDALSTMESAGEVARHDGRIFPVPGSLVPVYGTMLRTYFEAYRLAVNALDLVHDRDIKRKDWVKQSLARGRQMVLAGDLDHMESRSKAKLDNALGALHDLGFVRISKDNLGPGPRLQDPGALRELDDMLRRYLAT